MPRMWVVGKVPQDLHEYAVAEAKSIGVSLPEFVKITVEWYRAQEAREINDFCLVHQALERRGEV